MSENRKRIWIDPFQTHLFVRIAGYFTLYQIAVWSFVFIVRRSTEVLESVVGGDATNFLLVFAVSSVVFLGFLFIYDAIKYVHRFVGPIYRIRKTILAVTAGEDVSLVTLRKDDFLGEFRDDFNEMLKALAERGSVTLRAEVPSDQKQPELV